MAWATVALVASFVGLLLLYELDRSPALLYALLGLGFAALTVAGAAAATVPLSRLHLLVVAALLRLLLLPVPPSLSNDVYRYLWDGRVVAAGYNPYALKPASEQLEGLQDEVYEQMSHRTVETVYPPLAMGLFSISARLPLPLLAYKTLLSAVDLLACGLLVQLAARLGSPRSRTLWYAWNPLVVLEVAGMGHVDALGVAALVATLLLLAPARRGGGERAPTGATARTSTTTAIAAGAAAAGGVLAKLAPLLCLPMWARQSGRPLLVLASALALVVAAALPIVWSTGGIPAGLVTYAVSWEFNGPLYEPLWRLLYGLEADRLIKAVLVGLQGIGGAHDLFDTLYAYAYPQLLAKGVLGLALVGLVLRSIGEREAVAGTRRLLGGALLLQATVYPWYVLWVLPTAALTAAPAWLVLSATMSLAYLPDLSGIAYFPWVYVLIWSPALLIQVATWWKGRPRWLCG